MTRSFHCLTVLCLLTVLILSGCSSTQVKHTYSQEDISQHIKWIESISMTRPYEALAAIDSALDAGMISQFEAQLTRAKVYFNPLQEDEKVIECVKDALGMASREMTDSRKVILLRLLGKSCYLSGEYEESMNAAIEGEQVATSMDSLAAKGEFMFIKGECMFKLGQIAQAYANMEYGIAALSREEGLHAKSTLSHFMGEVMNFMIEDGRIDEAIETGLKREKLLDGIAAKYGPTDFLDQQYGYLYGKMAFLFMIKGEREVADDYYERFWSTAYSKDRNGKLRILEYCLEAGLYSEALDIIGDTDFPSSCDTLTYDGQYYLAIKAEAMRGLGRYMEAYSLLRRSLSISDILERRTDKERALKFSTTYRTHEAELKAKESEARGTRYLMLLLVIAVLFIIMASGFVLYYNKTHSILEKNKLINMGRNDTQTYIRLLQSAQARIRQLEPKDSSLHDKLSEADSWQLFLKLEDAMDKDKLYLDKNLTREDILNLLEISKNRLGKVFQDVGTDLTLPTYINGKRLNHALGVIAEHPEYTVNEIADASGFSNTRNFHLQFKKRFGITPLQYRDGK